MITSLRAFVYHVLLASRASPIAAIAFRFYWHRTNSLFGESQATIIWDIPKDATRGTYRIRHFGAHKSLLQAVKSYVGVSNEFQVA